MSKQMNAVEINAKLSQIVSDLSVEELEEKIAPVDCTKKPDHPDCMPVIRYGGPIPPN